MLPGQLAVTIATEVKGLQHFHCWHVYVWVGARQPGTAFVVTNAITHRRVCVTYFPAHCTGKPLKGALIRARRQKHDADALDLTQDQMLEAIYRLAVEAVTSTEGRAVSS